MGQGHLGRIGIIGGNGMLGRAIAQGLLVHGGMAPEDLWISCRSGRADGLEAHAGLHVTTDNQELAETCDLVVLSVPPQAAGSIGIAAGDRLIVSVMAGVSLARLAELTGTSRVVRAMSSPAAAQGLAFSPWIAGEAVDMADRARVTAMFGACGSTAEVPSEDQVELFTALTGPVPGFVAFFAESMVEYAVERGVAPGVADRAIRQLFLGAGRMMAEEGPTPADHVREMIDYAGTTAAGLERLRKSRIAADLADGLDEAVAKTRQIGK